MNTFNLFTCTSGPVQTNTYLLTCHTTKQAVVIDPSFQSEPIISEQLLTHNAQLAGIWLTHSHWDHIADCTAFRKRYGKDLPIHLHFLDSENLIQPGSDGLPIPIPLSSESPSYVFREGSILECGKIRFQVLHTPGHSPGSSCFLELEGNTLFTGDTLFRGTYGNVSFPTSSPEEMVASLHKLVHLDREKDLCVYPGHGPKTRLEREKSWISQIIVHYGESEP